MVELFSDTFNVLRFNSFLTESVVIATGTADVCTLYIFIYSLYMAYFTTCFVTDIAMFVADVVDTGDVFVEMVFP